MAKPATLPRWLDDTTAADATIIVEPTEGKKTAGWVPLGKLPAQLTNWLFRWIYLWCKWLDEYEATAHTWTAAQDFTTVNASGVVATSVETTEGDIEHGDAELVIPAAAANPISGWALTGGGLSDATQSRWVAPGSAADLVFAVPLKKGDRIKTVKGFVYGDVAGLVSMILGKSGAGAFSQIGSTQQSSAAATAQTLTLASLTELVQENTAYAVAFTSPAAGTPAVYRVEVTYDRE